jgi:hypothetical protein
MHEAYTSLFHLIESMRWVGLWLTRELKKWIQNFSWKKVKARDNLKDLDINGRIISCAAWIGLHWLRIGFSSYLL